MKINENFYITIGGGGAYTAYVTRCCEYCSVEQIFTFMIDGSSNRGGGGPMSRDSYTISPGLRTEKDMRSILSTSAVERA